MNFSELPTHYSKEGHCIAEGSIVYLSKFPAISAWLPECLGGYSCGMDGRHGDSCYTLLSVL